MLNSIFATGYILSLFAVGSFIYFTVTEHKLGGRGLLFSAIANIIFGVAWMITDGQVTTIIPLIVVSVIMIFLAIAGACADETVNICGIISFLRGECTFHDFRRGEFKKPAH